MSRHQDDLQPEFGQVVRQLRVKLGMSQEMLAEEAYLTRNYIGNIERGEYSPSLAAITSIASALGKRPHELVKAAETLSLKVIDLQTQK